MPSVAANTDRLEDVLALLRRRGYRMTPQRRAIVAEIMSSSGHINPATMARSVQVGMPGVNASTVYRTLDLLEELGVLSHSHLERGPEYHRAEDASHVHLSCSRCGREDDLSVGETAELERLIHRHHGFLPDLSHFAISGTCKACQDLAAAGQRGTRGSPGTRGKPGRRDTRGVRPAGSRRS